MIEPSEDNTQIKKKKKVTNENMSISDMAKRAAKGDRAGIITKSDDQGCEHWGIQNMFNSGHIMAKNVQAYLQPGQFLYQNYWRGCNTPAAQVKKTKCNPIDNTYIYVCDNGIKGEVDCNCFFCHPCLMERKNKLEENNTRSRG